MTPSVRHLGLFAGLGLALAAHADPALAAHSPFLPTDSAGTAATDNTPLELRGLMADANGYKFSIYDPVKHTGQWVRLNEAGHDFTVRTHDVAKDTIALDYQGRTLTLMLHAAKVVNAPVPELSAGPRLAASPGNVIGPQPKPASPEEAARYNRAVEEINRRRAARERGDRGPAPTPK